MAGSDWIVTAPTTITGDTLGIDGDVVVRAGASLTISGSTLLVGGRILVEDDAELRMVPYAGKAARLEPLDPVRGFSVHVEGSIMSEGNPPTVIEGLNGQGIRSVVYSTGGLIINGTADLRDIRIVNGTAGMIVGPFGYLDLRDAVLQNLSLAGIATLGEARLENVSMADNIVGITARGARCKVHVTSSHLVSRSASVDAIGCRVEVEDSHVEGTSYALRIQGKHARLSILNSSVVGYQHAAFKGDGGGEVVMRNTTLVPAAGARNGFFLLPMSRLLLDNVSIVGHADHGILAQGSDLTIQGGRLMGNGGYGIRSVGGNVELAGDPDFGSHATANREGALAWIQRFTVLPMGPDNQTVPGLEFTLYAHGRDLPIFSAGNETTDAIDVMFNAFGHGGADPPSVAMPFTYRATHPGLSGPVMGELDFPPSPVLQIQVAAPSPPLGSEDHLAKPASSPHLLLLVTALMLAVLLFRGRRAKSARHKERD